MPPRSHTTKTPIPWAAAVAAFGALLGCSEPCPAWQPARSIDLGTNANLHAVAAPGIAVGSAGTVLVWNVGWGNRFESVPAVETFTLADVELRGVTEAGEGRWVVVGDGGFATVTDNWGQAWIPLDLGTSAHLHAAFVVGNSVVVVGDEVVRVVESDNTWREPVSPQSGWGQLRAGVSAPFSDDPRTFVVGLGGVISSTTDPSGVWTAEDSGVSADLFGVGPMDRTVVAVGTNGTFLVRELEAGEWSPIETERTVDFVDYEEFYPYGVVLTADGEILEIDQYDLGEGLRHIDRIEGASDLALLHYTGLIVVGDAGLAVSIGHVACGGH